ncbi:MAG: YfhO family protein [Planctomycetes bacterium]|nr:YfhO family protein [Planctomycetota bacterium]
MKSGTNKIEAHLYCGLIPLALAIYWVAVNGHFRQSSVSVTSTKGEKVDIERKSIPGLETQKRDRRELDWMSSEALRFEVIFWSLAGILAVIYATGILLPIAHHIPGFNFFRGPGRYGIVTTMAIAIFAGRAIDRIAKPETGLTYRKLMIVVVFWSTLGDLWLVSRMVTNVVMVRSPAVLNRLESPIRNILKEDTTTPRLYVPGQNVGNLLGVSCLPVYLGISPNQYSDPKFAGAGRPTTHLENEPVVSREEFKNWLKDMGVTHLISFEWLSVSDWNVELVWSGVDPLLNRSWGRPEPIYLYRLKADPSGRKPSRFEFNTRSKNFETSLGCPIKTNRFEVKIDSDEDGELILKELFYPGWEVQIDGKSEKMEPATNGLCRMVKLSAGKHVVVWEYRPRSVSVGVTLSGMALFVLAAVGHIRFWHGKWLDQQLRRWMGHQ